eukprot:3437911-Alexandrium_andersonii.AAC.1
MSERARAHVRRSNVALERFLLGMEGSGRPRGQGPARKWLPPAQAPGWARAWADSPQWPPGPGPRGRPRSSLEPKRSAPLPPPRTVGLNESLPVGELASVLGHAPGPSLKDSLPPSLRAVTLPSGRP